MRCGCCEPLFNRRWCAGFSLLELITVTAIILLLAATLLVGAIYGRKLSQVKATENAVRMLSMATHSYGADNNEEYPPAFVTADGWPATRWPPQPIYNPEKCSIQALCSFIFDNPNTGDSYAEAKDFPSRFVVWNGSRVDYICDSWEMPLFYFNPGAPTRNADSFDLFSSGPDQKTTGIVKGATNYSYLQHGVIAMVRIEHLTGTAEGRLADFTVGNVDKYKWKVIKKIDPSTYPGIVKWDDTQKKWVYDTSKYAYPSGHEEIEEYPSAGSYVYTDDPYKYPIVEDTNDLDKDGLANNTYIKYGSSWWGTNRYMTDWISWLTPGDHGKVYVAEMVPATPAYIMNTIGADLLSPLHREFGGSHGVYKVAGSFLRQRITDGKYTLDDIGNW